MNGPPSQPSASSSPTSVRQSKADDTRWRLFAAGAELLATQGYHATSVEQITRRARVAKGTFFLHFPTKDALVVELVKVQVGMVKQEHARLRAEAASPVSRLRSMVVGLGRTYDVNVARAVFAASMDKEHIGIELDRLYAELMQLMIEDARDAVLVGELAKGTDAEAFGMLLMDAFVGASVSFATNPRGRSFVERIEAIVELHLSIFGPAPRR